MNHLHQPPQRLANRRILVVDDAEDILALWRAVFEFHGADVATAASVNEALALYQTFHPDVIVSDLSMPERDGFDFIRTLREELEPAEGHFTPAIAVSGHPASYSRDLSLSLGFQAYLNKPVRNDVLVDHVARYLTPVNQPA